MSVCSNVSLTLRHLITCWGIKIQVLIEGAIVTNKMNTSNQTDDRETTVNTLYVGEWNLSTYGVKTTR